MSTYALTLIEKCLDKANHSLESRVQLEQIEQNLIIAFTDSGNNANPKVFAEEIQYTANSQLEAAARNNGNIAWTKWRVIGEDQQAYGYNYDPLNRLTEANYGNDKKTCAIQRVNWYDVKIKNYDPRGNIGNITRNGLLDIVN